MRRAVWILFSILFAFTLTVPRAAAAPLAGAPGSPQPLAWDAIFGPAATAGSKSGPLVKLGSELALLYFEHAAHRKSRSAEPFAPSGFFHIRDERVTIDAIAANPNDAARLRADLEALGFLHGGTAGRYVSGALPIDALAAAAALPSLRLVHPARPMGPPREFPPELRSFDPRGVAISQGDIAQRSDIARSSFGFDGTGVTVGVLSDGHDARGGAFRDVQLGDIPPDVLVLLDQPGTSDEGRAMIQIIRDVAPGVGFAFHTGFGGQAVFANGIHALADAGARVIVDDLFYTNEPIFQDGVIAAAVDDVVGDGVCYFSSAGNNARFSYEAPFRASGMIGLFGEEHDYDPGAGVDVRQQLTVPGTTNGVIILQWADRWFSVSGGAGAQSDIDLFLYDAAGTTVLAQSTADNLGGDAIEGIGYTGLPPGTYNLAIENFSGPDPSVLKIMIFTSAGPVPSLEYPTDSGTCVGHANTNGAVAVAAAFYNDTPPFGTSPALVEPFSSAGGVTVLFDNDGNPISEDRLKPDVTAPDGGNTSFFIQDIPDPGNGSDADGWPNFFGTSAAAPHAAGVAALMKAGDPSLTPADVRAALAGTADDMDDPSTPGFDTGFDYGTGSGFLRSDAALTQAMGPPSGLPPTIRHRPLADTDAASWPPGIDADANDNFLVDAVDIIWRKNATPQTGFPLPRIQGDYFSGSFPPISVTNGDIIEYRISARDNEANTTLDPPSGWHAVNITSAHAVLVLDDDELPRLAGEARSSALDIANALANAGFQVTIEQAFSSNPATWNDYMFLVSASGGNLDPVANLAYRDALGAYIAAGGRLVVEGGEVVHDALETPGYADFAANVLHVSSWNAHNGGSIETFGRPDHPLNTTPNGISSVSIAFGDDASQDGFVGAAGTYRVAETDLGADDAILIFEEMGAAGARVIVLGFDFKDYGNVSQREALAANIGAYLSGLPKTGVVSGIVRWPGDAGPFGWSFVRQVGQSWGVFTSDVDGTYRMLGLPPSTNAYTALRTGFYDKTSGPFPVFAGVETPGVDFTLRTNQSVRYCDEPILAIPDANPAGVTSVIQVADFGSISGVEVWVDIQHTWIGDLIVELRHGTDNVRLENNINVSPNDGSDDVIGTYPTTLAVDGPGSLADFVGDDVQGTWTLFLSDGFAPDPGHLIDWCLFVNGAIVGVSDPSAAPRAFALHAARPNPFNPRTSIRYEIAEASAARLSIFDVGGRRLRVLVDEGRLAPGRYEATWDGTTGQGRAVASGVYFYRLEAGAFEETRQMVLAR